MYIGGGGGHFSIWGVTFLYWKSDPRVNFAYGKVTHGSHFHRATFPYDTGSDSSLISPKIFNSKLNGLPAKDQP